MRWSDPTHPNQCRISLMVKPLPSKQMLRVRFSYAAPERGKAYGEDNVYKLRMSARALVDKLNLAAVDGLMIVEDGGVNYYGRL